MAVHRAPQAAGRWRKLVLIVVPPVVLLAGAAILFIAGTDEPELPLDANLCPLDGGDSANAVLLLDFRKPLGTAAVSLAGDVLRDVTVGLPRHAQLQVFALTSSSGAPRQFIRRFCKPYGNEQISVGSAKDGGEIRDCDDLPAQITAQTMENATRFCALREQVGAEIQRLAERPLATPVPNAYLVEAIEETSLAFAEEPGERLLYVFSDMLQHADWFSHAERGSQGWGFNDFIHMREMEEAIVGPRPPPLDGVGVTIYYVPREGVTDAPRPRMNHKTFWRQYFTDALGAAPGFKELDTLAAYPVAPLLDTLTEAEKLAQERKRLEAQSKRLERAAAEYEAAQEQAKQARERADAARRAVEEQAAREAEEQAAREAAEEQAAQDQVAQERAAQEEAAPSAAATAPAAVAQAAESPPAQAPEEAPTTSEPDPDPPPPAETVRQVAAAQPQTPPRPPAPRPAEPAEQDDPYCSATLQSQFRNTNAYPIRNRRLNLGAADIAVEFVVDEQGETVDESVQAVLDASTATRPNYLDVFAEEARSVVRGWAFDFDTAQAGCQKRQTVRARVKFEY